MPQAAILLFADTETPEGIGRMANALTTVKEFQDAGDDAVLIFDGAGTRWVPALADAGHKYHHLLEDIRERVQGACGYCARAYGVKEPSKRPASRCSTTTVVTRASATSWPRDVTS